MSGHTPARQEDLYTSEWSWEDRVPLMSGRFSRCLSDSNGLGIIRHEARTWDVLPGHRALLAAAPGMFAALEAVQYRPSNPEMVGVCEDLCVGCGQPEDTPCTPDCLIATALRAARGEGA